MSAPHPLKLHCAGRSLLRRAGAAGWLVLALLCARPGRGAADPPAWEEALTRRLEAGDNSIPSVPHRSDRRSPVILTKPVSEPREPSEWIPALIDWPGGATELEALGFRILGGRRDGFAVFGTAESYRRLAAEPAGLRVARLARPMETWLDRSLPGLGIGAVRTGAGPTWDGPTGRGVVVGIVDTGLDIHHADFRHPDGSTRLLSFWDQTVSHVSPEVPIGALYRRPELDRLLSTTSAIGIGFDVNGHGTHVAGIAAGDGSAGGLGAPFQFVGVAPEADLVVVRSYLNEASVVGAVQFIFDEAERLGRPAVVNLSLGHQYGPHDGTSLFERLLSEMCGPGRLLVVAAGNDGGLGIHASLAGGEGADSISFRIPPAANPGDLVNVLGFDVWGPFDRAHRFTLVFPDGRRIGPFLPGKSAVLQGPDYSLNAEQIRYPFGRNFNLDLRLFGRPWPTGTFHLVATADGGGSRAPLEFWIPYFDLNGPRVPAFVRGRRESGTLSEPANARNALSVAATVSRNCWISASRADSVCSEPPGVVGELVFYSSTGPTPDGREKPEVAAPGDGIASALSESMAEAIAAQRNMPLRLTPDGRHWISSGTSMAAPHVAGALALLLERAPELTPELARERLRATGRPLAAPVGTYVGPSLDLARFLRMPGGLGQVALSVVPGPRARFDWSPVATDGVAARFRVARGRSPHGPFDVVGGLDSPFPPTGTLVLEDGPLEPGRSYFYRLSVVDVEGVDLPLDTLGVTIPGSPRLSLSGPRTNPGPLPVRLTLFLPEVSSTTEWRVEIFDAQGRRVARAGAGEWGPGAAELPLTWEGGTTRGQRIAGGVYFARLTAGREQRSVKLIVRG